MFKLEVILILLSIMSEYSLEGKKASKMRLVGGNNERQGRLEVKVNGNWGTVAPLSVTERGPTEQEISREICRRLGFSSNVARYLKGDKFGPGEGLIYTIQTKVYKKRPERPFKLWLEECKGKGEGPICTHDDDLGLDCDNWELFSKDSKNIEYDGYLYTHLNQGWRPITYYPLYQGGNLETNLVYYINHRVACNTFGADTTNTRYLGMDTYAIKHEPSDFSQNWPEYICSNEVKIKENKHCSFNISTETAFNIEKFKTTVRLECERKLQRKPFQKELKQCVSVDKSTPMNLKAHFSCPPNHHVTNITVKHGIDSVIFGYSAVCKWHFYKWCVDNTNMEYYFNKIKNNCQGRSKCQADGMFLKKMYKSCNATERLTRIFTYNCVPIPSEYWIQTVDYYGFQKYGPMHTFFDVNDDLLYKRETWGMTHLIGEPIEEVTKRIACDDFYFERSPQRHVEEEEDEQFKAVSINHNWQEHYHLECGPKDKYLYDCKLSSIEQGDGGTMDVEYQRHLRCIDDLVENYDYKGKFGFCATHDQKGETTCDYHYRNYNPPYELCCNCWLMFKDPFTLEVHPWSVMSKAAKTACRYKDYEKICPCTPWA